MALRRRLSRPRAALRIPASRPASGASHGHHPTTRARRAAALSTTPSASAVPPPPSPPASPPAAPPRAASMTHATRLPIRQLAGRAQTHVQMLALLPLHTGDTGRHNRHRGDFQLEPEIEAGYVAQEIARQARSHPKKHDKLRFFGRRNPKTTMARRQGSGSDLERMDKGKALRARLEEEGRRHQVAEEDRRHGKLAGGPPARGGGPAAECSHPRSECA